MKTLKLTHILHADAWGEERLGPDERQARCGYMTAWLTEHEGDHLSITVRPSRPGEADGTVTSRGTRGFDVAEETDGAVTSDALRSLLNRAWEAACQVGDDDGLRALAVSAGEAGDTKTVELVTAALAGDKGARDCVMGHLIDTLAKNLEA